MKLRIYFTIIGAFLMVFTPSSGQENQRIVSSSSFLKPTSFPGGQVIFSVSGEGKRFNPTWGLDLAWISEQNFRKGINHMGKENVGVGRSAFRMTHTLVNDTDLANDPIYYLRQRTNIFNIHSADLPIVFTADQEPGVISYYRNGNTANVDRWAAMINAHVKWMNENSRHRVIGVSPFNEPDYWTEEGATTSNSRDIAKKLKEEYPLFSNISIVGANTLNDDKAISWYNPGKDYYDWGNTHQLAGSMDNYKAFYQLLARDGKVGYNDEMHNVAEAFIGLEYGMTVGIWWGFDSRARGEFCDISRHGVRLGYAEHPNNWTAATVYRHDNGKVKAFMGSSERQAYTTSYQFVSTDHEVYYDGEGPTREIQLVIHGGTGYQKGQKNAERVIDVTWGEDVQPSVINGTYKIMNKASLMVVSERGTAGSNVNISQSSYSNLATQQWEVKPAGSSVDGDYSFHIIKSVNDGKFMDVLNFSTQSGGNVISFGSGTPSTNQLWYLEYAGDGYYFIRNRESALYLTLSSNSKIQGININQQTLLDNPDRQMWRFLPLDAPCDTIKPATPTGLRATSYPAGVLLEWEAVTDNNLDGYMLLRADKETGKWNTIARKLKDTKFIDNSCRQGRTYEYKVKTIDVSENCSDASEMVEAAPTGEPSMIARWTMDDDLLDSSVNQLDAAFYGSPVYNTTKRQGIKSLTFNGSSNYVQLPYEIASTPEMTFSGWIYWLNTSTINQRIFDFGNGSSQYMYLTPSDGNAISFVINDGKEEQRVKCNTKLIGARWKHIAVSIANGKTSIYLDGEEIGSSTAITIHPSDFHPLLNFIGRAQNNSTPLLKAYMDDIRIYNYALDEEEVRKVMDDAVDGIYPVDDTTTIDHSFLYNIQGIRVTHPSRKGIYIQQDGTKYIIR